MANFFTQNYINTLKNHYLDYKGRASRKQYGFYILSHFLVIIAFILVAAILTRLVGIGLTEKVGGIVLLLWFLATLPPTLCIIIRRLHDAGQSGWYFLLVIPVGFFFRGAVPAAIGALIAIKGQPHDNRYGPVP